MARLVVFFFFSSRRRHTRSKRDWSSDVCSSDLTGWLEENRPSMSAPSIIHGDYSPFNVMVAPDPPARLAAIVDWDTGTIGDPLLDIGHLLARWTEPGEESVIGVQAG